MGKQIKVQVVKAVYYGKIIETPQGRMDLQKLYHPGSVIMIDEDDFTDADKALPGTRIYGAYRRIAEAAPEVPPAAPSMEALKAQVKAPPEVQAPKPVVQAGRK